MSRKAQLLEEKRRKWMQSRDIHEITESVQKENSAVATNRNNRSRGEDSVPSERHSKQHHSESGPVKMGAKETAGSFGGPTSYDTRQTDLFLHKLTDKLTSHIRDEVQKEMQLSMRTTDVREKVAEKMQSYLEGELSTHTCKICFELMTSPNHTPILLFPCGHTFCQLCMDTHTGTRASAQHHNTSASSNNAKTCPYCRY